MPSKPSSSTSSVDKPVAWLLLRDNHVVPIRGLEPDALKRSAWETIRASNQEFGHEAILNAIAKHLGFKGGFAGYKSALPDLQAMLERAGAREWADLFAAVYPPPPALQLRRRAVADRLFASRLPLPERLFLGVGFDWTRLDGYGLSHEPLLEPLPSLVARIKGDPERRRRLLASRCVVDRIGLLDDSLVTPRLRAGWIPQVYFEKTRPSDEVERQRAEFAAEVELFAAEIDDTTAGWARVVPFGGRLAFLVLDDGRYDFVFADLRDRPPPVIEDFFDGQLADEDVPSFARIQAAPQLGQYRARGRWEDWESHHAEIRYYAEGGMPQGYPGLQPSLPRIEVRDGSPLPGFRAVGDLWVSDLVTIGELESFLADSGYAARRMEKTDRLGPPNRDPKDLPATLNYYDALAYSAWFERKTGRRVRLLQLREYLRIHPGAVVNVASSADALVGASPPDIDPAYYGMEAAFRDGCLEWLDEGGRPREKWGWIGDEDAVRFRRRLTWRQGEGGVKFLCDLAFGEWLADANSQAAAAICTATLRSIHDRGFPPEGDFFPARSWGKYRACKLGFRLCYERVASEGRQP